MIPSRLLPGSSAPPPARPWSWRLLVAGVALCLPLCLPLKSARAALGRAIQVAGTSTGAGTFVITIESFPPGPFDPRRYPAGLAPRDAAGLASTMINVPVNSGSSPYSTSTSITAAINAALYPGIVARSVIFRDPAIGRVVTDVGTFTLSIAGGAPGQTVTETSPICCPAVDPLGILALGGGIVALGLWRLRRREGLG